MQKPFNVLLTSVGRRGYLVRYFKKVLEGKGQVYATNSIPGTSGMIQADDNFIVPPAYDSAYLETMLKICKEKNIRMLLSLHDLEPPFLVHHRERFEAIGTRLVMADPDFIDVSLDKYKTVDYAESIGLKTTRVFLNPQDALDAVKKQEVKFPLFLKPRYGYASHGLFTASDKTELEFFWQYLKKEVLRTDIAGFNGMVPDECVLIQEKLVGDEYGLDIINDLDGNFVTCVVEKKMEMRAGETESAEIVDYPELFELGKHLASKSKHPGVLDIDVIVQEDTPFLLEMNPRFGGHYPFAHEAGVNIPAALVAWAEGKTADPSWLTAKTGVKAVKDLTIVSG